MVYLDNYSRKHKHKPVLTKRERETVVGKIMDILDDWRSSPFEKEAACRYGLRQGLCVRGHSWEMADFESGLVVEMALQRNKSVRPTWEEGQREVTIAAEQCLWCRADLSEMQYFRGERYCSTICARSALTHRTFEAAWYLSRAGRAAYRSIERARTVPRVCQQCDGAFQVHSETMAQIFCSRVCRAVASRKSDRACKNCGTLFTPGKKSNECCSFSCRNAFRFANAAIVKECPGCGGSFIARSSKAKTCSTRCRSRIRKVARPAAIVVPFPTIDPAVFDREFLQAA